MYGSSGLVQETRPVMCRKRPLNKACTGQSDSYSSTRTPVHLTCTSSSPPPIGGTTDSYRYTARVPLPPKAKALAGQTPAHHHAGGPRQEYTPPVATDRPTPLSSGMLGKKN